MGIIDDGRSAAEGGARRTGGVVLPPARLADVARMAGVSKGTASKALNDKSDVRSETRLRVLEAAEALSFRPSAIARNLTSGRTGTVGILTNDLDGRFVLPILAGAEDALGAGEISVLLCDARGDAIREQRHLKTLLERRIDGLIVVGGARTEPRPTLGRDLPIPVVYAYAPSSSPDDLSLVSDNRLGGRVAAEHLWEIGRRRIAYIGGDASFVASREREEGARAALADLGGELIADGALYGDWTERWGRAMASRLLQSNPEIDAIIAASDGLARAALDVLRDQGRRVPEDVAVVGYDNWSIIVQNTRPELTSIDMELEAMGRLAASRLFGALSGHDLGSGVEALPVQLIVRASTVKDDLDGGSPG
ncbi:LacI family DNA-binding transcriptional regulator [Leifsonia sp. C5G2]|uniref:LacI family DNA-binding transcriptional regulator n=1 Tax=Leifsonia sp. C5G2 TaxID=2735269 RepID=UPI00158496D9|nr:LacI family DNA-binding transcriptional regulator [Leifsonia sp. C5G2]NUU05234.1 LacI family DNA-binding transcriptional regulator [Leifsonia sp. C5G2]